MRNLSKYECYPKKATPISNIDEAKAWWYAQKGKGIDVFVNIGKYSIIVNITAKQLREYARQLID